MIKWRFFFFFNFLNFRIFGFLDLYLTHPFQESLASSKRPGSEKAKGEAQAMFEQFKKATTNRLVAREDKMTYEQAKAVHEGSLKGFIFGYLA